MWEEKHGIKWKPAAYSPITAESILL